MGLQEALWGGQRDRVHGANRVVVTQHSQRPKVGEFHPESVNIPHLALRYLKEFQSKPRVAICPVSLFIILSSASSHSWSSIKQQVKAASEKPHQVASEISSYT